jgi:hypothetical protein
LNNGISQASAEDNLSGIVMNYSIGESGETIFIETNDTISELKPTENMLTPRISIV